MASPTDLETYQIGRGTVVIEALFGSGLLPTAKPKILARRNTRGPDPLDLKQRSWPGWHPATCVFVFDGRFKPSVLRMDKTCILRRKGVHHKSLAGVCRRPHVL